MKSERQLSIEFGDGDVDEYRIRKRNVEFRARHRAAHYGAPPTGAWRRLDSGDIALHLALHTPVAGWLMVRLLKRTGGRASFPPAFLAKDGGR